MELRHLRYFVAVADQLSFSGAAQRLHVSQPPLSRQIRDLERELGASLFDRDRQGVRLTGAGHHLLALSRKLLADAETLRSEAAILGRTIEEDLQIGYAPSPTAPIIAELLSRYNQLAPRSRITLHDLEHAEMLARLRAGTLHAALTIRPRPGDLIGMKFEPIRFFQAGMICARRSPLFRGRTVEPSAAAKGDLIVYRTKAFPEYHWWVAKVLGVARSELNIVQECDSVLSMIAAVESGHGVSVVGEFITALSGERVRYVPFTSTSHALELGLLYRARVSAENLRKLIAASRRFRSEPEMKT